VGTELSNTDRGRAAGSTPDLVRLADAMGWTLAAGIDMAQREDVASAIDVAEMRCRALKDVELVSRGSDGQWVGQCKAVRNWLKPFGMMIAPGLAPEARTNWLNALLVSLSDLPPETIMLAAQMAMHKPMTFLNEVHGAIRTIAEQIFISRRLSLTRLRELQAELARASDRSRQLPAPPDELSSDDIRRMSTSMRALGLKCGALTQAQIDEALMFEEQPASHAA
jgi:hypothetical protein